MDKAGWPKPEKSMAPAPHYVLGHSDAELERLKLQSTVFGDVTRRMIRESGIQTGMRVLDIGCGFGDLSMLLADAVGPAGKVVAIDREQRAVDAARNRTEAAGYKQIEIVVATDEALPDDDPFDAAVGRYVLVHQPDPAGTVRRAAGAVRRGGIVAFQEPAMGIPNFIFPMVEIHKAVFAFPSWPELIKAFVSSPEAGVRLVPIFRDAGLQAPRSIFESVVGDRNSQQVTLYAIGMRGMAALSEQLKIAPPDLGDLDTLSERLRAQMAEVDAQIISQPQACVWATRP
jgi:2-polyprenyl-3-methyl-5-hydroxy-6-metoxy-1,4-benzoquinol methylase